MRLGQRLLSFVALALMPNLGCATTMVWKLGDRREVFPDYRRVLQRDTEITITYWVNVSDSWMPQHTAQRWAVVQLRTLPWASPIDSTLWDERYASLMLSGREDPLPNTAAAAEIPLQFPNSDQHDVELNRRQAVENALKLRPFAVNRLYTSHMRCLLLAARQSVTGHEDGWAKVCVPAEANYNSGWYPVNLLGLPVAVALDVVTAPAQYLLGFLMLSGMH
jgi:hypothetical protein